MTAPVSISTATCPSATSRPAHPASATGRVPVQGATGSAPVAGGVPATFQRGQLDLRFRVLGADRQPLPRCQVMVHGRNFPGQGETDRNGEVTISVFGETPDSIAALYVKPFADCW